MPQPSDAATGVATHATPSTSYKCFSYDCSLAWPTLMLRAGLWLAQRGGLLTGIPEAGSKRSG